MGFKRIILRLVHFALSIGLAILLFRPVGRMVQSHMEGAAAGADPDRRRDRPVRRHPFGLWTCFFIIRSAIARSTASAGQHFDKAFKAAGLHPLDRILGATAGGMLALAPLTCYSPPCTSARKCEMPCRFGKSISGADRPAGDRRRDRRDSARAERPVAESIQRAKQAVTTDLADELGSMAEEVAKRVNRGRQPGANDGPGQPSKDELRRALARLLNGETP